MPQWPSSLQCGRASDGGMATQGSQGGWTAPHTSSCRLPSFLTDTKSFGPPQPSQQPVPLRSTQSSALLHAVTSLLRMSSTTHSLFTQLGTKYL